MGKNIPKLQIGPYDIKEIHKTKVNCDERLHHKVQSAAQIKQYTLQNMHTKVNLF